MVQVIFDLIWAAPWPLDSVLQRLARAPISGLGAKGGSRSRDAFGVNAFTLANP